MWDQALLPLSPKGYSAEAMNENVTSPTAIYLKCVTTMSPHAPARSPLCCSFGPADTGNLCTKAQVSREGRVLTGGKEWGNAHDFLGNLFFICERAVMALASPLIYAWMSEGG